MNFKKQTWPSWENCLLRVHIISWEDIDFVNTLNYVIEHIFIFIIIQRKKIKAYQKTIEQRKRLFWEKYLDWMLTYFNC